MYSEELLMPPVPVDPEAIRRFTSDDEFMRLAVELTKETAAVVSVAACAGHPNKAADGIEPWPRNKAVLCGLLVRLSKLFHGLLMATCDRRGELAYVFLRPIFETCVNLTYLQRSGPASFDEYVRFSLRVEKELMDLVRENIAKRNKVALPIEERMLGSIRSAFESSGVDPATVNADERRPFDGKSIFRRAAAVGLDSAYLAAFSLPSHAVHGNWQDLLQHHLREVDGGFLPEAKWTTPKPQMLEAPCILALEALDGYLEAEFGDAAKNVLNRARDLRDRVLQFSRLNEGYLAERQLRNRST